MEEEKCKGKSEELLSKNEHSTYAISDELYLIKYAAF